MWTLRLLFGFKEGVTRSRYVCWGVLLMFLKYAGESSLYYLASESLLSPVSFLSPWLGERYPDFNRLPDWFGPVVVLWSIPFLWIGTGMSIRRAVNAGGSPWIGLLFFIPLVNYLMILFLSLFPSRPGGRRISRKITEKKRIIPPLVYTIVFAICGALLAWLSTSFFMTYATSLFIGSPLILGVIQGFMMNHKRPMSLGKAVTYVVLTILLINSLLLLFALEGLICLMMALPISLILGIVGCVFGAMIARLYSAKNSIPPAAMIILLPFLPWAESKVTNPYNDIVLSTIEIDASPEEIWPNVVKFAELPPATEWLFKLGVAHPVRARIEGKGVGAIRYCEFSTGAFVEPITAWDKHNRLAFDVMYQPHPMKELSFYDRVDAPHLDGYFRSVRGEFRLIPLPGGKTLLEGRTWYEMEIYPGWYWQIYGRWFIHTIHNRVLRHIKSLTENQ